MFFSCITACLYIPVHSGSSVLIVLKLHYSNDQQLYLLPFHSQGIVVRWFVLSADLQSRYVNTVNAAVRPPEFIKRLKQVILKHLTL